MLRVLLALSFLAFSCAFKLSMPVQWSQAGRMATSRLAANKIDGVSVEGSLQPIGDNLLVRVKKLKSTTASGIIIPDNAKERPTEGAVVAVGPGRVHEGTSVRFLVDAAPGESVLYGKYDGAEIKYNDEDHQIIRDEDILLKYTGDQATVDNVTPVKDQVLVKLPPKEEKTASGIVLTTPDNKDKKRDTGVVVKVGPGRKDNHGALIEVQVRAGDRVKFREYVGVQIKLDGADYAVVRSYDILAKW